MIRDLLNDIPKPDQRFLVDFSFVPWLLSSCHVGQYLVQDGYDFALCIPYTNPIPCFPPKIFTKDCFVQGRGYHFKTILLRSRLFVLQKMSWFHVWPIFSFPAKQQMPYYLLDFQIENKLIKLPSIFSLIIKIIKIVFY